MTHDVTETDTIIVSVPIALRKRSGRKTVDAPARLPTIISGNPSGDEALIKALARAFRWRTLIETGVHSTVAEIAAAEKVNPSYASRILRLSLLAPDIVEEILDRRLLASITLDHLMRPFPVVWERQRAAFSETAG
jgi:hypothetical protein